LALIRDKKILLFEIFLYLFQFFENNLLLSIYFSCRNRSFLKVQNKYYTKHLLWFVDLQNNLEFYNLPCLSFVQGLTCKWISAQELRLMMGYKSLIKTALGLGLVRLKLGWIGQDKLSLNNKEKYFCPANRYNGSSQYSKIF
jgi:hypothetical protein